MSENNGVTAGAKGGIRDLHKRMYDWVLKWAETPYGLLALCVMAFIESSVFPIPPDVLLIALVLATPKKWYYIAAWTTVASVLGGLVGYGIGYSLWETLGQWIVQSLVGIQLVEVDGRLDLALPSYMAKHFGEVLGGQYIFQVYDKWNAWVVFIFGLTPLPYKLVTVTAGMAQLDLGVFTMASVLARGTRFFMVALFLRVVGEPAKEFIDKNFNLLSILFVLLLIGGFLVIKLAV